MGEAQARKLSGFEGDSRDSEKPKSVAMRQRILVAEDSQAVRQQLVDVLSDVPGVEVAVAADGLRALAMAKEQPPALLICDNEMPGMSGIQLVRILRGSWSRFELPILMLTVHSATHTKVTAFQYGANDYVTKPVEPAELKARVQSQLDLRKAVEESFKARVQLLEVRRYQAVGRLAAGVAHELNNPAQATSCHLSFLRHACGVMTNTLARVQSVLQDGEGLGPLREIWSRDKIGGILEETPRAVEDAAQGIKRMASIIRELTDFAGEASPSVGPVDVPRALYQTVDIARRTWERELSIELDMAPSVPSAHGCEHALKQVFFSLLTNALEATQGCADPSVSIRCCRAEGGLRVVFEDNGPGISSELKTQIFDPFFSTKPVGNGTGQGLFLAFAIVVQQHGGRLTCDSEPGCGARFTIWLPQSSSSQSVPPRTS